MEYLAALLTAICLWLLLRELRGPRQSLRAKYGGPLLLRVPLRGPRRTRALALLALIPIAIVALGDPKGLFISAFVALGLIDLALDPRDCLEVRQRGVIVPVDGQLTLVHYSHIRYCQRKSAGGELLIQLDEWRVRFALPSRREDAVTAALGRYVEVRDASGRTIAAGAKPQSAGLSESGADSAEQTEKLAFSRFQFTLRTLLVAVVAAAAGSGWLGIRHHRARKQQAIVAPQQAALDQLKPFKPVLFWDGFHVRDLFFLWPPAFGDNQLKPLEQLTGLRHLILCAPNVTDAGLVHLRNLRQLESLRLPLTGITDAGLVHLKNLTELKSLDLACTGITDAGLLYLHRLSTLERIDLSGTRVTKQGVAKLRRALPGVEVLR